MSEQEEDESNAANDYNEILNLRTKHLSKVDFDETSLEKLRMNSQMIYNSDKNVLDKDAQFKEEFLNTAIIHPFKVESSNPLKPNMSESSIEIDDHAAHLISSPVNNSFSPSRAYLDEIKPDKWNNIPYPLVD